MKVPVIRRQHGGSEIHELQERRFDYVEPRPDPLAHLTAEQRRELDALKREIARAEAAADKIDRQLSELSSERAQLEQRLRHIGDARREAERHARRWSGV